MFVLVSFLCLYLSSFCVCIDLWSSSCFFLVFVRLSSHVSNGLVLVFGWFSSCVY